MGKILCFRINNNDIYLDKGLVFYNDDPIFFVCKDNLNHYYLVLASDLDNLEYYIVEKGVKAIWEILAQKTTMRDALLDCQSFWLVKSGCSIEEDVVERLSVSEMDKDVLPVEGAFYEKNNNSDLSYLHRIESAYLNSKNFIEDESISLHCDKAYVALLDYCSSRTISVECEQFITNSYNIGFSLSDIDDSVNLVLQYKTELEEKKEVFKFNNPIEQKETEIYKEKAIVA